MSKPPYRGLSFGLRLASALVAVFGAFAIFSGKPLVMQVFMHPPASEVSNLLLSMLKGFGGVMLTISAMLFFAARNPVRNVAIIDGLILGLCALSLSAMLSVKILNGIYSPYLIWGKALGHLGLAGLLLYARPRGSAAPQ
jgi:hypothetical protein